MHRLARFVSVIEANALAAYLREHGIACEVVGHHVQDLALAYRYLRKGAGGPYELMLLDKAQRADAELVLESFESEPVELDPDWEHVAERLDLSLLDPEACAIACPACGSELSLDERITACPACAAPVDIIQRIVDTHGPDALADAIVEDPDDDEA